MGLLTRLERWSGAVGVDLDAERATTMRRFWQAVLEENERTNLTRITADEEATLKHFVDSLSVLTLDVFSPAARVVDIGTGAGFPGIPLKIARPDLHVTLIDARLRRVRFLQAVVDDLNLEDVVALHGRAEQLASEPKFRGTFDVAVARAVARMDKLTNWCLPFVRRGGHFIAMKGPGVDEELDASLPAIKKLGGRVTKVHRLELPQQAGSRTLVVVQRQEGNRRV